MGVVFINYRAVDNPLAAACIHDMLARRFGGDRVFRDSVSMGPGDHYPTKLREALDRADVLVAVIGPRWNQLTDEWGRLLIQRDGDWVRGEIARAIERGIPIVPVLLRDTPDDAAPPDRRILPPNISGLADYQTFDVSQRRLGEDLDRLSTQLVALVPSLDGQRHRPSAPVQPFQPLQPIRPVQPGRLGGILHVGGVVAAAGCFVAANFLPLGSGYFTEPSGLRQAQVTLAFNLGHPLARAIATGPDGPKVDVAWWLAPVLGIGTAVLLAIAVIFPLFVRSTDPDIKAISTGMYKVSQAWVAFFLVCVLVAFLTSVVNVPNYASGLYERDVADPGGWLLFAASVMLASVLRRTGIRFGQPWATQPRRRR